MNDIKKVMLKKDKNELLHLLSKLRLNYNLYIEDDEEVIQAIDLLTEEVSYNVDEVEELK